MSTPVHSCLLDDSITDVLATMKGLRLRRLPVIDANGTPQGVISINDIVLAAGQSGNPAPIEVVTAMAFMWAWKRRWRDYRSRRSSSLSKPIDAGTDDRLIDDLG